MPWEWSWIHIYWEIWQDSQLSKDVFQCPLAKKKTVAHQNSKYYFWSLVLNKCFIYFRTHTKLLSRQCFSPLVHIGWNSPCHWNRKSWRYHKYVWLKSQPAGHLRYSRLQLWWIEDLFRGVSFALLITFQMAFSSKMEISADVWLSDKLSVNLYIWFSTQTGVRRMIQPTSSIWGLENLPQYIGQITIFFNPELLNLIAQLNCHHINSQKIQHLFINEMFVSF